MKPFAHIRRMLPLVALTPAPACEGYRNKAQFPVAMGKNGIEAGFFEKGTHNVVPVEHCRIQPACAEQARSAVLRYARHWNVPAYDEAAHTGLLRHIYVRHAEATDQVLVCLVVNGERLPQEDALVDTLRKAVPGLRSVVLNTNTRRGNAVLGETMRTLWGDDAIEDILCGLRFRISPRSFYQVNRTQAERLYGKALAAAGLTGTETVLDLYCGTGTITLCLARQAKRAIGVAGKRPPQRHRERGILLRGCRAGRPAPLRRRGDAGCHRRRSAAQGPFRRCHRGHGPHGPAAHGLCLL